MVSSTFFPQNAEHERVLNDYPRVPRAVSENGNVRPAPRHQYSLVACARWETDYIVEWLTYHRSIGFDHVYLYCNDDDPCPLYEKVLPFIQSGFVTFVHYSFTGLQFQMYFHFLWSYSTESQWFMLFDVDEFLVLRGLDNIRAFMVPFQADDAVYFNWCSFGNNGHQTRPGGSVLKNYVRRESGATPFTKVLIKSASVPYEAIWGNPDAPINHDYAGLDRSLKCRNVLHEDMNSYYDNFPDSGWAFLHHDNRRERIIQTAFVAHYNIKSDEDFDIRVRRSLSGAFAGQKIWGEMSPEAREDYHRATNAVEDRYLHDYWTNYLSRAWAAAVFPPSQWTLLSRGKSAHQGSTEHHRTPQDDAESVLSGVLRGRPQNRTAHEKNPWWLIDFGKDCRVHEMRLFSGLRGAMEQVSNFQVDMSNDGQNWNTIHIKNDDRIYGGADGSPYIWVEKRGLVARFVRIIIIAPEGGSLMFDQIEFYGTEL